jgi:hypothetical protein
MAGMFKSPKAPTPTNPTQVIAQSNAQKIEEERRQGLNNRVNQANQYGNESQWTQGPNGQWQQTSTLGGYGQEAATGLSGLGQQYYGGVNQFMNNRPDMSSMAAFDKADQLWQQTEEPRMQRQRDAEMTRLRNMGFEGSAEGYQGAMGDLAQQQGDARARFTLGAQGQMHSQGLAERNQEMGEFGLLNPGVNFGMGAINSGQSGVPGINVGSVDVGGAYNSAFNQQQQVYQQQMQQQNAMWGGLAGLGGAALGGPIGGMIGNSMFGGGGGGQYQYVQPGYDPSTGSYR